ncbi:MAG: response regulator transcription factor [Fimbriimonadales bacterium]|nr:MAG: DNA-binding response regulator [Fimbriimonadales bacterium]
MPHRVLVIEDDGFLRENLIRLLEQYQYEAVGVGNAAAAIRALAETEYHLIVLDLGLPDADGFDVCRRIRQKWRTPILMLTARTDSMDKVIGLELGADDYLTKPFEPKELLARVRALLRRAYEYQSEPSQETTRCFGEIVIDYARRQVLVRGQPISLTRREYDLLAYLTQNANRVIPREQLFEQVWGYSIEFSSNTLDVYMYRLRKKIERDPDQPQHLITHRSYGYEFRIA